MSSVRVFVANSASSADSADTGEWTELTAGERPTVRLRARDLQHAQRASRRIRDGAAVSVVLDVTVLIDDDYRSARRRMPTPPGGSVEYAGTLDGLVGLVDDIVTAGVADGVTLIPAVPQQDVRSVGEQTLLRLRSRRRSCAQGRQSSVPAVR